MDRAARLGACNAVCEKLVIKGRCFWMTIGSGNLVKVSGLCPPRELRYAACGPSGLCARTNPPKVVRNSLIWFATSEPVDHRRQIDDPRPAGSDDLPVPAEHVVTRVVNNAVEIPTASSEALGVEPPVAIAWTCSSSSTIPCAPDPETARWATACAAGRR